MSMLLMVSVGFAMDQEKQKGGLQDRGNSFGRHKDGPKDRGIRMFDKLNLTQEQKSTALEKFQDLEKQTLTNKQKIQTLQMKMSVEMKKDNPDKKTVMDIIQEIYNNKTVIAQKRIGTIIDIKAGLTAEQKQKLNETGFKQKGR